MRVLPLACALLAAVPFIPAEASAGGYFRGYRAGGAHWDARSPYHPGWRYRHHHARYLSQGPVLAGPALPYAYPASAWVSVVQLSPNNVLYNVPVPAVSTSVGPAIPYCPPEGLYLR